MKKIKKAGIMVMILAGLFCTDVLPAVQASELEGGLVDDSERMTAAEPADGDMAPETENGNVPLGTEGLGENQLEAEAVQAEVTSGSCGQNASWSFDENSGTLTISGSGAMENYPLSFVDLNTPWNNFRNRINKVVIENGITAIGTCAFLGCSLTSIAIPDSVTNIESFAFQGCSSLTEVSIPNSVTVIGDYAFRYSGIERITISNSVTTIGDGMFLMCSNLREVSVPKGVTSIGRTAFYECSSLTKVNLPDTLTSIGNVAFDGCKSLTEINLSDTGIENIGYGAFNECNSLVQASLPNTVTNIDNLAFKGCSSLTEINLPDSISKISAGMFDGCESLQKVSFGNHVTAIGSCAFQSCRNLTEVNLPDTVAKIEYNAFYNCSNLPNVTIPASLSRIEGGAFGECTSLSSVRFMGNAPEFSSERADANEPPFPYDGSYTTPMEPFANVTASVYYPSDNTTWTSDNMLDYGGHLTWMRESHPTVDVNPSETVPNGNVNGTDAGLSNNLYIDPIVTDKVYVIGSGTGAVIKCTGKLKDFVSIAIDDVVLSPSDYTAVSGSTVITIMSSYLDKLSVGTHKVTLKYTYGSVDTTLLVLDRGTGGTNSDILTGILNGGNQSNPGVSNGGNQSNAGSQKAGEGSGNETGNKKAPKTEDNANSCLPIVMLLLCSGGLVLVKRRAL